VLIVIGVLVGGIVAGNSLIKAARIQSVITDFEKYKKAAIDFKSKYYYWPGDMPNAYDYWASDASCANSSAPNGCNGGGDGAVTIRTEDMRGWQFLKIAGFISGSFSGTAYNTLVPITLKPGTNIPTSSYEHPVGSYTTMTVTNSFDLYNATFSSTSKFAVSLFGAGSSTDIVEGSMRPTDAKAMDKKIDDGSAASGYIAGSNGSTTCLTSGEYDIANNSTRLCVVHYRIE